MTLKMHPHYQPQDADRRLANTLQVGTVLSVNPANGTVRVRVGDLQTTDMTVMQVRMGGIKFYSMPHVGEQVMVGSPNGDIARGVVVGSLINDNLPTPTDKNIPVFDCGTGIFYVKASELWFKGNVKVEGTVTAEAFIEAPVSLP